MRPAAAVLKFPLLASLLAMPVSAQIPDRRACITPAELQAEAIVRTGVELREVLKSCAARGYSGPIPAEDALAEFRRFDEASKRRILAARAQRVIVFERNFPGRKAVEQELDAAIINIYQGRQMTDGQCRSAVELMRIIAKEGWPAFQKQVEVTIKHLEPYAIDCKVQ